MMARTRVRLENVSAVSPVTVNRPLSFGEPPNHAVLHGLRLQERQQGLQAQHQFLQASAEIPRSSSSLAGQTTARRPSNQRN